MKLLLDTHIWVWSHTDAARLRPRVARELARAGNELWLSPVSIWELILLTEHGGRLDLNEEVGPWIEKALAMVPMKEASLNFDVARETRRFRLPHRDPADILIVATASVFELTLVTADERLLDVGVSVLPNR